MKARNTRDWLGIFFMGAVAVCNGSALGQVQALPADPGDAQNVFADDDQALPAGQDVTVGAYGQIDLHVKDLDLTKVLQLLSIQSEKNIIASRNVAGAVSADLYGVDFYDALAAILHPNGFGFQEEGQFIYVYTTEELKQIQDENRATEHRLIRLSYLSGADAATFVTPMLSAAGSVAVSADASGGFVPTVSDGGSNGFAHADTLMITDYAENIEKIVDIIKQLDVRPKQVVLESTILQTRLTEANAFGVDFSIFADLDLLDFTSPLGAFDELIDNTPGADSGSVLRSTAGNVDAGRATVKFGVLSDDVAVFVRALDEVSDTNVIARPRTLVLNRQKADLLVGERLGYISTNASETSTTQTVEFLDVGTQLSIRPFIGEDNFVRLELRSSVSDGETQLVGGFVIPSTNTAEMITNVMVKSGETAVLGGLFKEDTTVGRSQVPGVGSLPVVGNAFKGQDDTVSRSEVIFMIKPTVMKDKYLYEMSEATADGIEMSKIGIRQGLLPWSRSKMVNWQMREAHKQLEAGNTDKAKWHADLALSMDSTVIEARELREEITGKSTYHYDFSILNGAVDAAIENQVNHEASAVEAEAEAEQAEATTEEAETVEAVVEEDATAEVVEPKTEVTETVAEATEPTAAETDTLAPVMDTEQAGMHEEDADESAAFEKGVSDAEFADFQPEADATESDATEVAAEQEDFFFSDAETESDAAESDPQTNLLDVVDAWLPGEEDVAADEAPVESEPVQVTEVETPVE